MFSNIIYWSIWVWMYYFFNVFKIISLSTLLMQDFCFGKFIFKPLFSLILIKYTLKERHLYETSKQKRRHSCQSSIICLHPNIKQTVVSPTATLLCLLLLSVVGEWNINEHISKMKLIGLRTNQRHGIDEFCRWILHDNYTSNWGIIYKIKINFKQIKMMKYLENMFVVFVAHFF